MNMSENQEIDEYYESYYLYDDILTYYGVEELELEYEYPEND